MNTLAGLLPVVAGVRFKDMPGFSGCYCVGDDGSVWTRKLHGSIAGKLRSEWTLLAQRTNRTGYRVVSLSHHGKSFHFLVHRLVIEAFGPPKREGHECCHNDSNPANNHIGNLRWDTHAGNMRDSVLQGRARGAGRGSLNHNTILTESDIPEIFRLRAAGWSYSQIARQFPVAKPTIVSVLRRDSWKYVIIDPAPGPEAH